MGTIIKFPRSKKQPNKVQIDDFFVEKLPSHKQHCNTGDINFTCAECGNVAKFNFAGIVFKECNFYCGMCGTGYKLDNPLFGKNKDSKSK